MKQRWAVMLLPVVLGCASDAPAQACRDFVTTVGDVAERCGFDRAETEESVEQSASMDMGCGQIDRVRDIDAFYDVCIPFFASFTCEEFETFDVVLPAECIDQLLVIL